MARSVAGGGHATVTRDGTLSTYESYADRAWAHGTPLQCIHDNQVALDALIKGSGEERVHDDLDFLVGSMSRNEAKRLDAEIERQRRIDPELWK